MPSGLNGDIGAGPGARPPMSTAPATPPSPPSAPPPPHAFQPFVPASQSPPELTVRGLVLGAFLGVVFAASSVYLAIKVGMTVSASIPIAVLSIAVFRAFGKASILENTIVQTTGSAGESLAFGVAAALPALLFMGYDIDLFHAFLTAALGGILGVLMMIPLRHGLIVQEHGKLTYPEGTACADVLIVGEQGGTNARTVIVGFAAGGIYKLAYSGFKLWKEVIGFPLSWTTQVAGKPVVTGYVGGSLAAEISPELLGVGYIIGPKVAAVTFAGGVLAYLVLIPAIVFFGGETVIGGVAVKAMEPDEIRNHYLLYIGAGAVATGGLISLGRSLPTIVNAFRRGVQTFLDSRKADAPKLLRTEQDLPITVVIVGSLALVLLIWLLPPLHINLLAAVLIVIFGFFFVTVSSRITGEIGSSSNPISGMVVATLLLTCLLFLVLGWTTPGDRFMALTTAAIVGIAASNGGTTAQDLKTAYLVGGTPYRQQIALFVGVVTSAALIGGTLVVLNNGATAIIPEPHDGALTEVTDTVRVQYAVPWSASTALDNDSMEAAFWAENLELATDGSALVVRSFDPIDAAQLSAMTLPLPDGKSLRLADLGAFGVPVTRELHEGFVRSNPDIPTGKYLADATGHIQYLVDPGIGGRIASFRGRDYPRYDAPKARLFSLIIDGILTQQLPWTLVLLGVFIALMLELCGVSSLPFAVGVYLPISTSTPIFVGGMVRYLVDRIRGGNEAEAEFSPGVLLSSGYIAGGAIAGVILAMLAIPGGGKYLGVIDLPAQAAAHGIPGAGVLQAIGESHEAVLWASVLWGSFVFLGLAGLLLWTALTAGGGAEAHAPKAK
jgi:putative OPT family oligopeptide transporter